METVSAPKIKIVVDRDQELDFFLKFLHSEEFPRNREKIFSVHPKLLDYLETNKDERVAVRKYLDEFYAANQKAVDAAIERAQHDFLRADEALRLLAGAMDYEWREETEYTAYPTVLPFSPFGDGVFLFSILQEVKTGKAGSALMTAVHEISHFIFFDFLSQWENSHHNGIVEPSVKYYLKEGLTAAIFNEEPLRSFFEIKEYAGNPDIRDIRILVDGEEDTLVNFLRKELKKKKSGHFEQRLDKILISFVGITDQFSEKRKFWNKYGPEIARREDLLTEYRRPIKL